MSLIGLLFFTTFSTLIVVIVALAFARAVFYANVLTELDGSNEIQRRLLARGRPPRPMPDVDPGFSTPRETDEADAGGRRSVFSPLFPARSSGAPLSSSRE